MEKPADTAPMNVVHHVHVHLEQVQLRVTPVKSAVYHVTMKREKGYAYNYQSVKCSSCVLSGCQYQLMTDKNVRV